MMEFIEYSVDGGVTWARAPEGIRITVFFPEEQLLFNFTGEGLITDHFNRGGYCGTDSATYGEIAFGLEK